MAIIEVNKDNFEEEVLKSDKKVLVDFWADWCGPCKMLSPVIDKLAEELEDVKVCKVNVDTEPTISIEYNIMSIPTLLVFENCVEVNRSVGLVSKEEVLVVDVITGISEQGEEYTHPEVSKTWEAYERVEKKRNNIYDLMLATRKSSKQDNNSDNKTITQIISDIMTTDDFVIDVKPENIE